MLSGFYSFFTGPFPFLSLGLTTFLPTPPLKSNEETTVPPVIALVFPVPPVFGSVFFFPGDGPQPNSEFSVPQPFFFCLGLVCLTTTDGLGGI